MKHNMIRGTIVMILFATFCLTLAPATRAQDEGQCSLASVAGKYGFTLTGTLLLPTGPVLAAAVGKAILDADGNLSGTEARNVGGSFADETFTGTLTVNPDCTGAATLKFFQSGALVRTSVLALVFDDNRKELRIVQKSLTLPDGTNLPVVITANAKRISTEKE